MVKHATHKEVHMNIPSEKLKKLAKGHRIQLSHSEISHGPCHFTLHHETAKKLHSARACGKGMRVGPLTHEEIHASGSLWDTIKTGFNKYVKPVLSGVGDAIAYANPELAPLREGVRNITGVGIAKKPTKTKAPSKAGSAEMKAKMAKIRSMKKGGAKHESGSFLLY